MAKSLSVDPDDCPECWMSQRGQRQHDSTPCSCSLGRYHDGTCRCRCDSTPPPRKRDLADLVKRIAVHEVRPGDVLVFEINDRICDQEHDELQQRIRKEFGDQTLSIVINGKFSGVLRRKGDVLVEVTGFDGPRTYVEGNPGSRP